MKNGIVVIGNVFVDIKGFPFNNYIPAGRNAGNVEFVHGGVGRNVAEDIANLELRPTFLSMVDTTAQGEEVIKKLSNHKVNTRFMITSPDGMGIWLAIFDETGDVVGSISKRPAMEPLTELIEQKGDEIFCDCDSIVLEIDMDKDLVKQVLRYAAKYRKKVFAVVANMSIAAERRDFLQQIDCFVCNEQEAGILFVEDFSSLAPEVFAEILSEKVINAKAGVAAGLTYGKDLRGAVEIGTKLAASVITVSENVCPRFRPEELGLVVNLPEYPALYFGDEDLVK